MSDSPPLELKNPIDQLLYLIARLRDPKDGCPWDLKQTYESIVPYTLEEAHEVADAVDTKDPEQIKDEVGDLLLQVVLYAQIAKDQGDFDFDDVTENIVAKMLRRHPHVFPDGSLQSRADGRTDSKLDSSDSNAQAISEVKANWETIKQQEQLVKGDTRSSTIDGVPASLPSILKAQKLQKKAAKQGFDWPSANGAMAKLLEEVGELQETFNVDLDFATEFEKDCVADELGDVMFSCVNVARLLNLDADAVMRAANRKFEQRYRQMEQVVLERAADTNHTDASTPSAEQALGAASLDEMEAAWNEAKRGLQAASKEVLNKPA